MSKLQPPAFVVPDRDILDVCALGDISHLEACLRDEASRDAAVQYRDALGVGALHVASTHGQYRACELLLAAGADPNQADLSGLTPLMCAAANGHGGIVQLLLAQPTIDVGLVSRDFETALFFARAGRFAHLEILLEPLTRAKVTSADILEAAGTGDKLFVALAYLDTIAGSSGSGKSAEEEAALPAAAKQLFSQTTETGDNAVIVCAKIGTPKAEHLSIVEFLLKRKLVDVDATNANGSTALMYAARSNHGPLIELLLSFRANPCISAAKDDPSRTAASMATDPVLRVQLEYAERKREFDDLYATRNDIKFEDRPDYVQHVLQTRQRMLEVKSALDVVLTGQPDPRYA